MLRIDGFDTAITQERLGLAGYTGLDEHGNRVFVYGERSATLVAGDASSPAFGLGVTLAVQHPAPYLAYVREDALVGADTDSTLQRPEPSEWAYSPLRQLWVRSMTRDHFRSVASDWARSSLGMLPAVVRKHGVASDALNNCAIRSRWFVAVTELPSHRIEQFAWMLLAAVCRGETARVGRIRRTIESHNLPASHVEMIDERLALLLWTYKG